MSMAIVRIFAPSMLGYLFDQQAVGRWAEGGLEQVDEQVGKQVERRVGLCKGRIAIAGTRAGGVLPET